MPEDSPNLIDVVRMDRSCFRVARLGEDDSADFWRQRCVAERIEALELLRQIAYGCDPRSSRLQGFFEVAELGTGRVLDRRWVCDGRSRPTEGDR